MSFTYRNPIEITGNLFVHHLVREQAKAASAFTLVPVITPESYTPAPLPDNYYTRRGVVLDRGAEAA